ncbi:hypothetical protein R4Z09_26255 [Niallia oryzisoli]|uniref:N-acetyltransferase domain-containing protein n=1 Tax=Niallia oryzisoli TaxID=1737571 RepID=A0ABZ2CEK7_9BACI
MSLLKKIIKLILTRLFVRETVILFMMDQVKEIVSPAVIKKATYENINDILNFQEDKYLSTFKGFLEKGDIGYLGYLNSQCIHRTWVVTQEGTIIYMHPLLKRKLNKNEVYIHYCETSPSARGNNVYSHVISEIAKEYSNKKVLICVNRKNIPSIRGVIKAGYKPIESITVIALLGCVVNIKKDIKGVDLF